MAVAADATPHSASNPNAPTTQSSPPTSVAPVGDPVHIPSKVILRAPSIYGNETARQDADADTDAAQKHQQKWQPPPLAWLERTWTVTHSTLPMWRKAKNVRITYKLLPPRTASSSCPSSEPTLLDDEVCSEPTSKTWLPQPRSIRGVDTPDRTVPGGGGWNWRGKGWLRIASSHWEVLGWGEFVDEEGRREGWVVTWFGKSLFTPMGVDLYSDRKGGVGEALLAEVRRCIAEGGAGGSVARLCEGDELREVVIDDDA